MIIKKKIETLYLIEVSQEQKHCLVSAINALQTGTPFTYKELSEQEREVLADLRISLLNVG